MPDHPQFTTFPESYVTSPAMPDPQPGGSFRRRRISPSAMPVRPSPFRRPLAYIVAALLPLLQGCTLPGPGDSPVIVANLRFSPSAFDSFTRNTEIRYTLAAPVRVSVAILRSDSEAGTQLVKTLFSDLSESKGAHAHTWLGDTGQGRFAPAGEYVGIVTVSSQRFETTVRVFHF